MTMGRKEKNKAGGRVKKKAVMQKLMDLFNAEPERDHR